MSLAGCLAGCRIKSLTGGAWLEHAVGCPNLAATEPEEPYETVDHPQHYNDHPAGIEAIDVIEDMPFNVGTAVKYLWRAGLKPGTDADEDLRKALWYIDRERTRLRKRGAARAKREAGS